MTGTGIHNGVNAATYHADPADTPSLSSSIVKILCERSAAHAWIAHPKLNPLYVPQDDAKFDLGTVAHTMFLEGAENVHIIHADDWRTKAAKEQRDDARAAGSTPLLARDYYECVAMVDAIRAQLVKLDVDPPMFADGSPEQTVVWNEDGVLCRARLDWLRDDCTHIDDLKTTSRSAQRSSWTRSSLFNNGYDIQAAFYVRGVQALTGIAPTFRWCVVECQPPYALSVISPGAAVMALADAKIDHALSIWRDCLRTDEWPSYSSRLEVAELPAYAEAQWFDRIEAAA